MTSFSETRSLNQEQRELLKTGLEGISLGEVLEEVEENRGTLYLIEKDGLKGVAFLILYDNILTVRALGGKNLKEWASEWGEFLKTLMKKHQIPKLVIFSRKGWNRIFPDLTYEGSLYTYENPISTDSKVGGGLTR